MEAADVVRREITIDADAATVFAFFTDPQRLIRWMGVQFVQRRSRPWGGGLPQRHPPERAPSEVGQESCGGGGPSWCRIHDRAR